MWRARWLPWALLSLVLGACNRVPQYARPGALANWQGPTPDLPSRQLAQTPSETCWNQALTAERIQQEILDMELQARGPTVADSWAPAGLDLSTLPRPQAMFLLAHTPRISVEGVRFGGCRNLICILNRAFGQPDADVTGSLVYWYYLKTGTVLSATPFRSESPLSAEWVCRPGTSRPEEHLFTPTEIRRLVEIARSLPEGWAASAQAQVVYLFRRGFRPLRSAEQCRNLRGPEVNACLQCREQYVNSCGAPESSACAQSGIATTFFGSYGRYILETEAGLSTSEQYVNRQATFLRDLSGYAWFGFTHELIHLHDTPFGITDSNRFYALSGSDEWMRLSGWVWQTSVDATSGRGRRRATSTRRTLQRQGNPTPFLERTPGDTYASVSPMEDLAVTGSFARYDSERVASTVPEKYDYVTRTLFRGRRYTPQGLAETYREILSLQIAASLPQWIESCRAQPGSEAGDSLGISLLEGFPAFFRGCLRREFQSAFQGAIQRLKLNEMEACAWLPGRENALKESVLQTLRPQLETLLRAQDLIQPHLAAIRSLRESLDQQVDAREILQSCWNIENISREECFAARMREAFDAVAGQHRDALSGGQEEQRQLYLAAHPFGQTLDATLLGYRSALFGLEDRIEALARSQWERCNEESIFETPAGAATPLLEPFSGGATYVDPRVLNCLNQGALSRLHEVRQESASSDFPTLSPHAERFVDENILLPAWIRTLTERLGQDVNSETSRMGLIATALRQTIITSVLADASWSNGAFGTQSFQALCADRVLADPAFAEPQLSEQLASLRYLSADEWKGSLIREVCRNAEQTPTLQARLTDARNRFRAGVELLNASLQRAAQQVQADCLRIVPQTAAGTPQATESARQACSLTRWVPASEQVWAEWNRRRVGGNEFYTPALELSRRALWSHLGERVLQSLSRR
jgi:hypothetical protein